MKEKLIPHVKAINKHLTIDIEYTDIKELRTVFGEIQRQLNNGKTMNRQSSGTSLYEYKKTHLSFPDYREEIIDGSWCMVYPSKMNNKTE